MYFNLVLLHFVSGKLFGAEGCSWLNFILQYFWNDRKKSENILYQCVILNKNSSSDTESRVVKSFNDDSFTARTLFWKNSTELVSVAAGCWQPVSLWKSWIWLRRRRETMSAVICKLYAPLLSFQTNSPWNNSNAGPQGWPARWVAPRKVRWPVRINAAYVGHSAV